VNIVKRVSLIAALLGAGSMALSCGAAGIANTPPRSAPTGSDATVQRIVDTILAGRGAYERLVTLCDSFGHRLSGSPELEQAIEWARDVLSQEGHENVHLEPKWVRGEESAVMVTPRIEPFHMLGLGMSLPTPPEGITAEVVTVADEAELEALGASVAGKIVHFNNAMPDWTPEEGACYGHTVRFRLFGANMAAKLGAKAIIIRSVTAHSLRTPHTGTLVYRDDEPAIPAAAISTEDSDLLARLQAAGKPVQVRLTMNASRDGDSNSSNVVAELLGRELPDEVVIISGHIDSWDVGQGAHDDGSGVVMAMETLGTLRALGLRPRRTIRLVLWTNEENGMAGVKQYIRDHKEELPKIVAAIEADAGGFAPVSFGVAHVDEGKQTAAVKRVEAMLPELSKAAQMTVLPGRGAPDVSHFKKHGVPVIGLYTHGEHYFDYHHTEADTVDKVDPEELTRSAAAMAGLAWMIAEMPGRLDD
jgi:carboxypeptidase Q